MRLRQFALASLVLMMMLSLAGCAETKNLARPAAIVIQPGSGWVVGSFTVSNDKTERRNTEHTSLTLGLGGTTLEHNNNFVVTKDDFSDKRSRGYVFALQLPPGDHAFSWIRTYDNNGQAEWNWSDASFSVPVKVEADRVTYVGEVMFTSLMAKNLFGMRIIPRGGWLTFSDQTTRDLPLIDTRFPELRALPRETSVPRAITPAHPLVRFE
jgi:hypothetical protein